MVYDIVEGTTDIIQFQFLENGVPINLTNFTVTLLIEDRIGSTIFNPGTITVIDAANGRVQFLPTNTFIFIAANGPYLVRWKLTNNSTSAISYVPTSSRDVWNIIGL